MSEIKELQVAAEKAARLFEQAMSRKSEEERTLVLEAKTRIAAEMAQKHDAELAQLLSDKVAAQDRYDTALEARALKGEGSKFPLGTTMVEWSRRRRVWEPPSQPTGRKGVIEPWTRDSEKPDNVRWTNARIGDFVIRVLRKDGTPSKQFITMLRASDDWLPEDQKPKA